MASPEDPLPDVLTARQRLCLYHGTTFDRAKVLHVSEDEIDAAHLYKYGIKACNILSAGLGPLWLKRKGVDASSLPRLGFVALHLADESFAVEAQAAFGSVAVRSTFLKSADDAVCVANKALMPLLGLNVEDLLQMCAGFPIEAHAVLKQLPGEETLRGISCRTLLDTGIRRNALYECGYIAEDIATLVGAKPAEMQQLGYNS
jgi:hypothetical protein